MPKHEARRVTPKDKILGEKIRALRLNSNMPQEELAKKLGVTFQQIQKYEKGTNRITFNRLLEMADIFNVDLDYFVPPKKEPSTSAKQLQEWLAHPHYIRLLKAFAKIESQASAIALIHMAEQLGGK